MATLAETVGTPFYCYSTATLERHYRVFAGAFADVPSLVCYAMKANSNQAVITTLARLGAGADVVSERRAQARARRRHPAREDHVLRHRQDRARTRARGRRRHPVRQCRIRAGARAAVRDRRREGPPRQYLDPRQSRRRRQDPRQDRDRQVREQVRHSDQPGARSLCAMPRSCRALQVDRRRHAYRQPDHRPRPVRRCLRAAVRFRAHAARRRPRDLAMSISAAAWAFPIATTTSRRRIPTPMRRWSSGDARSRLHADLRARPVDRRQCRHPGHARDLREARRGQDLRHRRCRDERPDPADALRGASRDPAGARGRSGRRRGSIADVVGPVCETGDYPRARPRPAGAASRAICWRS